MIKRFISVCSVVILLFGICGCARTAVDIPAAETETESEGEADTEDTETDMPMGEYAQSEEEMIPPESVEGQGETDAESLDILRQIEEYRSHFIGLYTNGVLSDEFPALEFGMIIEEHSVSSDDSEGAYVTVYSDSSGRQLRYELRRYGETGSNVINYYLCDNFVWVSRQYNYYSSMTLKAGYSDVLYSTIENWIITDEAIYIMHDNGELEKIDKTQLDNEILMPKEIEAMAMGYYSQADTIAGIKYITWEAVDFNVVDLHFHLEDGSAVDKEVIANGVRDIVYKDITGDGIDEVLIYCGFANNICDWQLIYFYQIDHGNVTDISPSSKDIPELDNADRGIWNMWWIAAETMEGYSSPIYGLDDYSKENGFVYVVETLYIGYRDGKWELLQGFEADMQRDMR